MPTSTSDAAGEAGGLVAALRAQASALGFADLAVAAPGAVAEAGRRLRAAVAAGHHGEMGWMADRLDWRADPRTLWPAVRAVVMLADAYPAGADPLAVLAARERAALSVYAQGRDYHDAIKPRLKRLGRWLIAEAGGDIKVFVDTAPVMEKPLAAAAGLGWQGKHTNLVSRRLGSWFFLGAIFTTLDLGAGAPHPDRCGSCRRCLDICPTAAFPAPYRLDARRCIAYLTIELKGPIPAPMRPPIGNRVFGCDDCLAVCPWNRFAAASGAAAAGATGSAAGARAGAAATGAEAPLLAELAGLDSAGFRARFRGTPVKRIGRARLLRNVAVAIGNSGQASLVPAARRLAGDAEALVRGHAAWALGRLDPDAARAEARPDDPDPAVAAEWRAVLDPAGLGGRHQGR